MGKRQTNALSQIHVEHLSLHASVAKEQKQDLIGPMVHHILEQGLFLYLDEFQVTDVTDAMILKELFQRL